MGPVQWGSCGRRINSSELVATYASRKKDRMEKGWGGESYKETYASAMSEISFKHAVGSVEEKHFPVVQYLSRGTKVAWFN